MRYSKLFTKTTKNLPADETAKNAQLLIQAGFIHKQMAGVYAYLPLGKLVLDKIIQIIREEMDTIGGNELSLTALQAAEVWQKSGRWDDSVMDVWFKTKLASGTEIGLAPTHEEPLTDLMRNFISSYKDLPVLPYQFQIKFRNELRSKSGLMRGREFWMKDMYSFCRDEAEHQQFYDLISQTYDRVYQRLGIGDITYKTFASGGSFAKYSHEFQTLSQVGEDTIYVHESKKIAINKEVYNDEVLADLEIDKSELVERQAVEVGNIFTLGTKFSEALDLKYTDEAGKQQLVFMGSYGIGPSRLMGLLAEHFADEKGLVWPMAIAPVQVYLVQIGQQSLSWAEEIYQALTAAGVEVLFDDRQARPGEKFADAELMGIPYRVTVSDRLLDQPAKELEVVNRATGDTEMLTIERLIGRINQTKY